MNAQLQRRWPVIFLALCLGWGIISLLNIASEIGQPFGGFFANRERSSTVWEVDATTPPWWPGLSQATVQYNDRLLTIDGVPYGGVARAAFANAHRAGHPTVMLAVKRAEQDLTFQQPIVIFTFNQLLDFRLPDFIVGLCFWLLGLAVYSARPLEPVNRLFTATVGVVSLAFWCGVSDLFPASSFIANVSDVIWALSTPFIGLTIMHLALLFPQPTRRVNLEKLVWLYGVIAAVALVTVGSLLWQWNNVASAWASGLGVVANQIIIGGYALGVGVYLARLILLLMRPTSSRRTRRQAALMLWGMAFVLPHTFIQLERAFGTEQIPFFVNGLDSRFLLLAVPLTFALAILRYQTSQSTHPLLLLVFMVAISAFAASLGASILNRFDPLTEPPFASLFIIILLTSFFWSAQTSWQGFLSRFFQWERRSYAEVRQFGQHVFGRANLTRLPEDIAAALVANLQLERAAVWTWDDLAQVHTLAGQAGEAHIFLPERLMPTAPLTPRPIRLATVAAAHWLAPLGHALEVVVPLTVSGQPVGLLGLGKRWDEEIFDERDLEILDLIAQQAALFLLTAQQIEQLRQVPQKISAAQERERFAIAQELHDTVQQFLGRLPFHLQVSHDAVQADPSEAETILQRCIADVESAAQTVRQIRNNLSPLQLEKNLTLPLKLLVEHFRARNGYAPRLDISPEADEGLSLDARHALYRVIQQALDNIVEHAQAKAVTITLTAHDARIHFNVADDGVGMTDAQRAHASEEGSFGLKSMQARLTALGGELEIRSTPGEGTQVIGWLPRQAAGQRSGI